MTTVTDVRAAQDAESRTGMRLGRLGQNQVFLQPGSGGFMWKLPEHVIHALLLSNGNMSLAAFLPFMSLAPPSQHLACLYLANYQLLGNGPEHTDTEHTGTMRFPDTRGERELSHLRNSQNIS